MARKLFVLTEPRQGDIEFFVLIAQLVKKIQVVSFWFLR